MNVSTDFKRAIIKTVKDQADAVPQSFISLLASLRAGKVTANWDGYSVQMTAGNGRTTALQLPSGIQRDLSPQGMVELFSRIEDDYADAKQTLVSGGNATPTDQEIYNQLLLETRAIKGFTSNWAYLAK